MGDAGRSAPCQSAGPVSDLTRAPVRLTRLGRRLTVIGAAAAVAAAVAAACAGTIPPPGGPIRKEAAIILSFTPDTNAVNVHPHAAVIQFDEVVAERPSGSSDLAGLFLISPRAGEADVAWHRSHISVRPPHGFRPNTVYTITMLPGLADLHNNVRKIGAVLTFSTGPTIPATTLRGRVFDWQTGQVAPRAFVQALVRKDTSVIYVTVADSSGAFTLAHLPPDAYIVRGFVDANNNHTLDRIEIWDSAGINLTDTSRVELLAFLHDTLGPRISEITVRDSVTIRVTFDRGIDSSQDISARLFMIKAKDSTLVPITSARSAADYDSAVASVTRGHADSALRADSIRRVDSGLASRDTAAGRERRARLAARHDSALRARIPRPSRRSPVKEVVIQLGAPLEVGKYYRLQAIELRGLLGKTHTGDRVFSGPKPPASDSARGHSRADSARLLRLRGKKPAVDTTPPPPAAAPAPTSTPPSAPSSPPLSPPAPPPSTPASPPPSGTRSP
jgi:hypothetical protein